MGLKNKFPSEAHNFSRSVYIQFTIQVYYYKAREAKIRPIMTVEL